MPPILLSAINAVLWKPSELYFCVNPKMALSAFLSFRSPSAVTRAMAVFSVVDAAKAFSKAAVDSGVRIDTRVLAAASAR
ncbi:hypothetical protein D3C72_1504100 [compost metagenome]